MQPPHWRRAYRSIRLPASSIISGLTLSLPYSGWSIPRRYKHRRDYVSSISSLYASLDTVELIVRGVLDADFFLPPILIILVDGLIRINHFGSSNHQPHALPPSIILASQPRCFMDCAQAGPAQGTPVAEQFTRRQSLGVFP
jgi:hypothetical protein